MFKKYAASLLKEAGALPGAAFGAQPSTPPNQSSTPTINATFDEFYKWLQQQKTVRTGELAGDVESALGMADLFIREKGGNKPPTTGQDVYAPNAHSRNQYQPQPTEIIQNPPPPPAS